VNQEMSAALKSGECVAVFPEGTTSLGDTLLPFHASLLQPAVQSASTVWPTAIRYTHADGSVNPLASYVGEMSLGQSLKQILGQPELHAELIFMEAIPAHGKTRRELAQQTGMVIAGALKLSSHPQAITPPAEQLLPTVLLPA
jgi:1-acyl-sn-glycerol-3-phosphate acyltransferase